MKLLHKQWSYVNRIHAKMSMCHWKLYATWKNKIKEKYAKGNKILNNFLFSFIKNRIFTFKFDAPALKRKKCYFTQAWNEMIPKEIILRGFWAKKDKSREWITLTRRWTKELCVFFNSTSSLPALNTSKVNGQVQ